MNESGDQLKSEGSSPMRTAANLEFHERAALSTRKLHPTGCETRLGTVNDSLDAETSAYRRFRNCDRRRATESITVFKFPSLCGKVRTGALVIAKVLIPRFGPRWDMFDGEDENFAIFRGLSCALFSFLNFFSVPVWTSTGIFPSSINFFSLSHEAAASSPSY